MTALFRVTINYFLLLPLGGLIALLWANAAPDSYFALATNVRFVVNDVAMALFFGLIAQEVTEAVLPGGALHSWRRWLLPMLAAAGSLLGAALVYLGYVNWYYEQVLRDGCLRPPRSISRSPTCSCAACSGDIPPCRS
jgi:Na+/H+ antiporter NhaA